MAASYQTPGGPLFPDPRLLFEYVEQADTSALGSYFSAVVKQEVGHTSTLESDDSTSEIVPNDQNDSLANYDGTSEANNFGLERGLACISFTTVLAATGLEFEKGDFQTNLSITDGEKFTANLATYESDAVIKNGVDSIVRGCLGRITMAHTPSVLDESHATFHLAPKFEGINEYIDKPDQYRTATFELLRNANDIATQLERLGIDPSLAESLRAAHAAEVEGLLPEWAVANYWGLFQRPTADLFGHEWSQWLEADEWQKFHDYIDAAAVRAPQNSRFMHLLAANTTRNIQDLRDGVFEPIDQPQTEPGDEDPFDAAEIALSHRDDDEFFSESDQAAEDAYRQQLVRAQQKLAPFLHTTS